MTELTNEQLSDQISSLREDLRKKADKESLENLLKREDVRPKALVDGPEENKEPAPADPKPEGGAAKGGEQKENPDPNDLTTQKELEEATADSVWQHVKPMEFVGAALAWQALKFEIPTLFNLEIFTEKMLSKVELFKNEEGRGFQIQRSEYGWMSIKRRAAEANADGDGSDPTLPGDSDPANRTPPADGDNTNRTPPADGDNTNNAGNAGGDGSNGATPRARESRRARRRREREAQQAAGRAQSAGGPAGRTPSAGGRTPPRTPVPPTGPVRAVGDAARAAAPAVQGLTRDVNNLGGTGDRTSRTIG
ncbi:hypothetical protein [Streptomyces enissocaesilis]|uniref:Uncharacterized protein n=1 Tax=Streptomyces enissocaesilis TaxID=332589 RepID=A0ABN3XMF6_9ACTN